MITEDQRSARTRSIGGSDAAAVAGFSKWKTPHDVWREKYLKEKKEFSDAQKELMGWGNRLESSVIDKYEEVTGESVTRDIETITHNKHDYITANLDGFCEKTGTVLEVKTALRHDGWGQAGTDNIPVDYLCQVAHYCMLTDAGQADIAVLFSGNDFKLYHYERNKDLEALLLKKDIFFWENNVLKGIEPDAQTLSDVKFKYRMVDGSSKIADDEAMENYIRLKDLKEKEKAIKKAIESLKFEQQKKMGHATQLTDACGIPLHTWKQHEKKQFNQAYIKEHYPDAYQCALAEKKYRNFLIK